MNILDPKDTAKLILFCSLLTLLASCSTYKSRTDISTCLERGGRVEHVCIRKSAPGDNYCTQREHLCIGAMTHDAYAKHKRHQQDLKYKSQKLEYTPPPVLGKEEQDAQRLKGWKRQLDKYATEMRLMKNADKFSKLAWLSSRWCLKNNTSKIPNNYYNVDQINGKLNISYGEIGRMVKAYTHFEINGNYFDLWDASGSGPRDENKPGRRLKKISNKEVALMYIFEGNRLPGHYNSWTRDKKKMKNFMVTEASKIGPEDYIKNPQVYVKCE